MALGKGLHIAVRDGTGRWIANRDPGSGATHLGVFPVWERVRVMVTSAEVQKTRIQSGVRKKGRERGRREKRELFTWGSMRWIPAKITHYLQITHRLAPFPPAWACLVSPHGALVDFRSACYGFDLVGLDLVASPGCRLRVVACVPAVPIATPSSMFLGKVLST